MITDEEILEAHKRSHGVYPGHHNWDNPKWLQPSPEGWGIEYEPFRELLDRVWREAYYAGATDES